MNWNYVLVSLISALVGFCLGVWQSKSVVAAAKAEKQKALSDLQRAHNAIAGELHHLEDSAKARIKKVLHIA